MRKACKHTLTNILVMIFTFAAFTSFAEGIGFKEIEGEEAWKASLEEGNRDGKLIFVDLYTDWCGYCKMMDREVFSQEMVSNYFNESFINVKLDGESEFGATIAAKNEIEGYPTYLFLDADGNLVERITGYTEAPEFMERSKAVEQQWKGFNVVMAAYESGSMDQSQLPLLLDGLANRGQEQQAVGIASEAFEDLHERDRKNAENHFILLHAGKDLDGAAFQFVKKHFDSFDTLFAAKFLENAYQYNLMKAIDEKDTILLASVNQEVVSLYARDSEELEQGFFITKKLYLAAVEDWEGYDEAVMAFANKTGNQTMLYDEAYQVIESYQNVDAFTMAIGWMDKLNESEPTFEVYALKAYALGMMQEYPNALKAANQALEQAESEDQKNTANEIIKLVNKAMKGE